MPLMVTGGFRTRAGMEEAIAAGATHTHRHRPPRLRRSAVAPSACSPAKRRRCRPTRKRLRVGPGWLGPNSPITLLKMINGWGAQGWYCLQLLRMGDGLEPDLRMTVLQAFRKYAANETAAAKALKR